MATTIPRIVNNRVQFSKLEKEQQRSADVISPELFSPLLQICSFSHWLPVNKKANNPQVSWLSKVPVWEKFEATHNSYTVTGQGADLTLWIKIISMDWRRHTGPENHVSNHRKRKKDNDLRTASSNTILIASEKTRIATTSKWHWYTI